MVLTKDEEVIQAFSTDRTDASFDKGIRFGSTKRCLQQLNSKILFENFLEATYFLSRSASRKRGDLRTHVDCKT